MIATLLQMMEFIKNMPLEVIEAVFGGMGDGSSSRYYEGYRKVSFFCLYTVY